MAKPWYSNRVKLLNPLKDDMSCGCTGDTVRGHEPGSIRGQLHGTFFGKRLTVQPAVTTARIILVGLIFLALWAALPKPLMEPGGKVFDPLVDWFLSSLVGGSFCHYCRVPAQVGIYWASIIWTNIPTFGYLTGGILHDVRAIASRIGLTVIVARAGFSVQLHELKARWKAVSYLSLVPLVFEATVHAVFAKYMFNFPDYRWAFLQGFLASAVAPGNVIPGLFMLRDEGYTTGPPIIMFPAAVLDCVLSIWVINFFADMIFSDFPLGLAIALGPIQLLVGFGIGVVLALLFHHFVRVFLAEEPAIGRGRDIAIAYQYPEKHEDAVYLKVFWLFSGIALSLLFVGVHVNLSGGGAMAVMGLAMTVGTIWAPKRHAVEGPFSPSLHSPSVGHSVAVTTDPLSPNDPRSPSSITVSPEEYDKHLRLQCQHDFFVRHRTFLFQDYAWTWENIVMPALFAFAGARVDLTAIFSQEFFSKAIGPLLVGVLTRFLFAMPAGFGKGFSAGEIAFMGFGWIGKATVQAALGNVALDKVLELQAEGKDPGLEVQIAAENISKSAMLAAAIFAPLNAVLVMVLGRMWLRKDPS